MAQRMKTRTFRMLLTLFLAGMLLLHLLLAWNAADLIRKGYPDFTIFYSAGKIVRQGLGAKLYDEQTQYRIQQEFAAGVSIRQGDRKSTRLNSSHLVISYAVFCLKKKNK